MHQPNPPTSGSLVDGVYIITGAIESIDAQTFPAGRAKLGIKDGDGGYSIVSVPREFARALSLGDAVSLTVVAQ